MNADDPTYLVHAEVCKGSKPGNERVRIVLPSRQAFRRLDAGRLEATEAVQEPRTPAERFLFTLKRTVIGAPIATAQAEQERLTKFKALAVLSSDAISSVAYATEAILLVLAAAGSGNLRYTIFISMAIVALLFIVALSYRQTIPAYPNGGGSYIVAKDNLGTVPGLIAAASLMVDYVLTVAVSVSSGVAALATLFNLQSISLIVLINVVLIIVITMVNLRGVRESGSIFAIPTYIFIFSALLLILVGIIKAFVIGHQPLIGAFPYIKASEPLTLFLILKAFASGCSAMTGTEAISNGVPAFKKPEPRNAAMTLTWMAVILGTLFIGIGLLGLTYGVEANAASNPTVIGQIAHTVFNGPLLFMYPVFQFATLIILVLAANTSYSDFPRLSSLLARDHFLPHQFAFRGDRLAFTTGIIFLAILSNILVIAFKGNTTDLISLYAVGVFISFTLSQSGMVRHWWRLRSAHPGWLRSMLINGLGAVTTLMVAVTIASTKFLSGAWIVVALIPIMVLTFLAIHHHYMKVEHERTTEIPYSPQQIQQRLIVPIATCNEAAKQAVTYARSLTSQVVAVHISNQPERANTLRTAWNQWQEHFAARDQTQLEIIEPGHEPLLKTLLAYIDTTKLHHPAETITVVLPEAGEPSLIGRILHNPTMFRLKIALFLRPEIVVTNLSYHTQAPNLPTHQAHITNRFIVPIAGFDRAAIQSLAYARSFSHRVIAAHVAIDPQDAEHVHTQWNHLREHITMDEESQLVVIDSPFRALSRPLLAYIDAINELHPEDTLTVILPEFVVEHWWEFPLHNQTAFHLKTALLARPGIVVTDIPQHLRKRGMQQ
jgi:amino acid transporter